ncbi:hypothetical protein OUY_05885 [Wolbachia endosymbiont of Leptopilina clavipes]|uniref:hypothetical protein n=1 Tax=Wolbachia endosymbiont of Leptopilina clavipes TaxID=260213 RepID=UPI00111B1831|nr:hypothetical protein [Wolbachia endosymbiont of Leptopilina clavipes]TNK93527.1 hypothetical protein OUY_05885 [Wolbachia endosymbiont of Leptopilina clavipes]
MPGSGNKDNVTLASHTTVSENSAATPPTPAPRNTALQTNSASESSSDEERQKESNVANTETIYASIEPNTESPKKSRDNQTDSQHPTLSRSVSQETEFNEPCNRNESEKKPFENLSQHSDTPSTSPPSYKKDGSENSLLGDNKKTNRFLQKVKYTMQKKKVTMPFVGLITACCITSIVLAVKQREFIGFIGSVNPVTIFGVVLASCLVLGITWELMQAVRTKEHKITKRDTQEVLGEILDTLKQDEKCIKSLVLKYSNGNRVYFTFHSLPEKAKSNSNIVELTGQPIYYKSKVNSLINDRIWLPILGTVLITGNITFPLALYSTGGLSNIVSSYTNPTIYWPIVAISGTLLLFTLACTIHHWSKTDFKDYLLLHKQNANSENPNETAIKTVKSSQEKISSKLLQVVAERCGHPDITYIIN